MGCSAIAAAPTSDLKRKWLEGTPLTRLAPKHLYVVVLAYFTTTVSVAAFRNAGLFGFPSIEPGRESSIFVHIVLCVMVPATTLAPIYRVHRSIGIKTRRNAAILKKKTGILQPMTCHGQALNVFFNDITQKAQLLHYVNQTTLMTGLDGTMRLDRLEGQLKEGLTPAEIFSLGIIGTSRETPTCKELAAELKHVFSASSLQRILPQGIILIIVLAVTFFVPVGHASLHAGGLMSHPAYNISWFLYSTSAVLLACWYDFWSMRLSLRSSSSTDVGLALSWILLQTCLLAYPAYISVFPAQVRHQVFTRLTDLSTWVAVTGQVIACEAWISLQQRERHVFEVPSWITLELLLLEKAEEEIETSSKAAPAPKELDSLRPRISVRKHFESQNPGFGRLISGVSGLSNGTPSGTNPQELPSPSDGITVNV